MTAIGPYFLRRCFIVPDAERLASRGGRDVDVVVVVVSFDEDDFDEGEG